MCDKNVDSAGCSACRFTQAPKRAPQDMHATLLALLEAPCRLLFSWPGLATGEHPGPNTSKKLASCAREPPWLA